MILEEVVKRLVNIKYKLVKSICEQVKNMSREIREQTSLKTLPIALEVALHLIGAEIKR